MHPHHPKFQKDDEQEGQPHPVQDAALPQEDSAGRTRQFCQLREGQENQKKTYGKTTAISQFVPIGVIVHRSTLSLPVDQA